MKNYIIELKDANELSLILVGDSNWDYYKRVNRDEIYSIPKTEKSDCLPCYFGNTDYFNNFLNLRKKV